MRHYRLQVHKQATAARGSAEAELDKLTFIVLLVLSFVIFLLFFLRWEFSEVFPERRLAETLPNKGVKARPRTSAHALHSPFCLQ